MKQAPKLNLQLSRLDTLEVTFEVTTPVFGGGVHIDEANPQQKVVDARSPVRTSSVRGQLRFWWRATTGHTLGDLARLHAREATVWGAASTPGAVNLAVTIQPKVAGQVEVYRLEPKRDRPGFNCRAQDDDLAYGAFSLQTQEKQLRGPDRHEPGKLTKLAGEAALRLTFPSELRAEVELAVDAWLAYGGIGGRTRRGFGAVLATNRVSNVAPTPPRIDGVPALGEPFDIATGPDALAALKAGLRKLKTFRQGPEVGRNPGQQTNRPGRSRWPEPDAIRKLTNQSDPLHRDRVVKVDKFPRAAFGLPIVFHFQSKTDPKDTQLLPRGFERLASPLIIRPIRRGNQWVCIGLPLVTRGPKPRLELKGAPGTPLVDSSLSLQEAKEIKPLAGQIDPIAAFRDFAKGK